MTEHQRFTVLLERSVRKAFDALCVEAESNASTVARQLIEAFIRRAPHLRLSDYPPINIGTGAARSDRDPKVRLTVLMSPALKRGFAKACGEIDLTPSQVMRRLVARWIEAQGGAPSAATARNARGRVKREP